MANVTRSHGCSCFTNQDSPDDAITPGRPNVSSAGAAIWLTAFCVICTDTFRLPLLSVLYLTLALWSPVVPSETLDRHGEDKDVCCLLALPELPPTLLQYCSSHLFCLIFSLASSVLKAKIMLVHTQTQTTLYCSHLSISVVLEQACCYDFFFF